jgi:hypothetical protein
MVIFRIRAMQLLPSYDPNRRATLLFAALSICITLIALWSAQRQLFPLSEIRDWVTWPASEAAVRELLHQVFERPNRFTRAVPLFASRLIGEACGPNLACFNALTFLPLAAGLTGMLWFAARITGSVFVVMVSFVICVVSPPLWDALTWQATFIDRLALLIIAIFLHYSLWLNQSLKFGRLSFAKSISMSLGLLLIVIALMNTKESAWPTLLLLPLMPLLTLQGNTILAALLTDLRRVAGLALPSLLYATWFAWRYLQTGSDAFAQSWHTHAMSGNVWSNLQGYFAISLPRFATLVLFTTVGIAICLAWRANNSRVLARIAFLAIATVASLVVCLKVHGPSQYYVLITWVYMAVLWAVCLREVKEGIVSQEQLSSKQKIIMFAVLLGCTAGALERVSTRIRFDELNTRLTLSRNFTQSIHRAADLYGHNLCFVADPAQPKAYLFLDSVVPNVITRWVIGEQVTDATTCKRVALDAQMKLKLTTPVLADVNPQINKH